MWEHEVVGDRPKEGTTASIGWLVTDDNDL